MTSFTSEKISDSITRIFGFTGELMYLVEGTNSAVLVDTGAGIGHLKTYVEKLTIKPYSVILTHGHVDHAMGAQEFNTKVYLNHADKLIYKEHSKIEFRNLYISTTARDLLIEDGDLIPVHTTDFLDIKQGDIFNLGDITLEVYEVPGHTPGSIALLIREEKALILGDSCNDFTYLFHHSCPSIASYKQTLLNLKKLSDNKYEKVFLSHGSGNAPKCIINEVIKVCDDILSGNSDEHEFEFMGDKGVIAKAVGPSGRLDNGIGNIVYNQNNIN